jgi:hypothetical protein
MARLLNATYPHHTWYEWLFPVVPRSFWEDANNRRAFLEWFAREKGFTSLDDWYRVSTAEFKKYGGPLCHFRLGFDDDDDDADTMESGQGLRC